MAFVLKVEHEGELRRVLANRSGEGELSFAEVEGRIRDVFRFPSNSELKLTYQDKDGDIVTMANDHDLTDACIIQELNPLRLHAALMPAESASAPAGPKDKSVESIDEQSFPEIVENLVALYEPMFRNFFTAEQMPELLNHMVGRVIENVSAPSHTRQPTDANSNPPTESSKPEEKPEVHRHVTCDVCEMNPIVGPRYKSMKKFNYDLCGSCYEKEGNANEYKRIDQLLPRHGPAADGPAADGLASSHHGAVRMMRMSPANIMWRAGPGMPPSFVYGPRGGRCRMGYARC